MIDKKDLTQGALRLGFLCVFDQKLYWLEGRPEEKGRNVLVCDGNEVLPKSANIKSRLYEYGGAPYLITEEHIFYIDGDLWMDDKPLVPLKEGRFADMCFDKARNCLYAVREKDEQASIAHIDLDGKVSDIANTADFYAAPRLSPDSKSLCFLSWNAPNMPWDQTSLEVWDFASDPKTIATGSGIHHPIWHRDGTLYYIDDKSGFWNIYTQDGPVYPMEVDFGYPPWVLDIHRFCFVEDKIASIITENATDSLIIVDPKAKTHKTLDLPFTSYTDIATDGEKIYAIAASPTDASALIAIDPENETFETIKKSKPTTLDPNTISKPISISFDAHIFYYPPSKAIYDKPPLLMRCHGGPTANFFPTLNLETQFWSERGFACVDLNYRGSTGFGKAFRNQLYGHWGEFDVEDAVKALEYLKSHDLIDPTKCAIIGGSAGGFTALAAATFTDHFQAAISLFGISDLENLMKTTHKFEAHYNRNLIGPIDPKIRSPINHIDQINCPILLLQGSEDKVVPPSQSEDMHKALTEKGIPCIYHLFKGEGHGFRGASTIETSIDLQEKFLKQYLLLD